MLTFAQAAAEAERQRKIREEEERKAAEAERQRKIREEEERKTAAKALDPKNVQSLLPPGWIQQFDAASGRPFYVCPSTGQTQWMPPSVPVPAYR